MITKLEISAQKTELTPELKKYITKKIGRLDRFVPRKARESVHAEVHLKETKRKDQKQFTCSVVLQLPHGTLDASESTINMFAAVDIAETKLKQQLKKYKETHVGGTFQRRVFSRFRNRSDVNTI